CTPGEEISELNTLTITYPEGAKVELLPNWKNAMSNGGAGTLNATALLKDPVTSTPTVNSGYNWGSVVAEGNKVTFTLSNPYRLATAPNFGTAMYVPQGVFTVTISEGEDAGVYPNANIIACYQPLAMYQGRLGVIATDATGRADIQYLTEDDNFILSDALDHIIYTGYQALYPANTKPEAELIDIDTNEVIANYTGAAPAESLYLNSLSIDFTPVADDAEKVAALGDGSYKFVIKAETIQAGSATSATLKTFNDKDFTYELNTLKTAMNVSLENGMTIDELSSLTLSFDNVQLIALNPEIKPVVYWKKLRTEGVWAGEGIYDDIDITTEGYQVELKVEGMPEEATVAAGDDDFGIANAKAELVITPAITTPEKYYVHIPAGAMLLQGVVKSPSVDLEYVVEEMVAPEDFFTPVLPESYEFDLTQSAGAEEGEALGMAQILLAAPAGATMVADSEAKVQLQYGGETIAEIGIFGEDSEDMVGIVDMSTSQGGAYMFSFSGTAEEKFLQAGEYKVIIPAGLFTLTTQEEGSAAVTKAVKAGELTYTMTIPAAPTFEDYVKINTPSAPEFEVKDSFYGMAGMAIITLTAAPNVTINETSTAKMQLLYKADETAAAEVIAEVTAENIQVMGAAPFADGDETVAGKQLMIMFDESYENEGRIDPKFLQPGIYNVIIPEGILAVDGKNVPAGELEYILLPSEAKEYTFTIDPVDGTEFEGKISGQLTLTVEDAQEVIYDEKTGTLYDPEGKAVKLASSYPTPKGNTISWSFDENPNNPVEWVEGTYQFIIPAYTLWVDSNEYFTPANFPTEDIVVNLVVKAAAPGLADFDENIKRNTPAGEEFEMKDSFYGIAGMSFITLTAAPTVQINTESEAKVQLIFKGEGTPEPEVIAEVAVENIEFMGAAPFEGEDETVTGKQLGIIFDDAFMNGDAPDAKFQTPGNYTVVFPEGIFTSDKTPVSAGTISYTLLPSEAKDYTWTITPEADTEFDGTINGEIVLTVDGTIAFEGNTVGGLYNPDGQLLKFASSTPSGYMTKSLTWSLTENPNKPIEWVDGTYEFRIPAYSLWIDADEYFSPANFPTEDIVVSYVLKNGITGVAMIGVESADSYNVYTLDGKVVLLNATSDQMIDLAPGMYIINGKQAIIRK
ncbi:MAG: hypothetical protein K2J15_03615, partial [Muribaculaceae bacterium]|nr:hypothetical protein [Muribaculaceae bacterium]